MSPNRFRRGLLLFMLSFLAVPFMAVAAQAADVTVFAAASLQNVLDDAAKLYQTKTGDKVTISYAASSALAVAPKDSAVSLTIEKNFPLVETLGPDGKLAMASVDSVPAGKYGKAALTTLGVWDAVSPHVVQAENVRAALAFVAKGEAALGIVYGTDAKSEPAIRGRGVPENSHQDPLSRRAHRFSQAGGPQIPRISVVVRGRACLRGARLLDPRQGRLGERVVRDRRGTGSSIFPMT